MQGTKLKPTRDGAGEAPCATIQVGDPLNLDNGVKAGALHTVGDAIGDWGLDWDPVSWGALPGQHAGSDIDPLYYGQTLTGPIPIFESGASYCSPGGGSWTDVVPVKGFVWGLLYDVRYTGSPKSMWMTLDLATTYQVGTWWGGSNYGVTSPGPPVVVQ